MLTRLLTFLVFALTCAGRVHAEMEKATPESQGVDSRAVLKWIDACEKTFDGEKEGRVHGFVIVRHGKTVAEGSWKPFDTLNEPHMLYSHSKSFTSSAIGFLVDDGKLDLNEHVVDIFPESLPAKVSDNLRALRVRDLLTMNAGKNAHLFGNDPDSWVRNFLKQNFDRAPGSGFKYDSDASFMLAAIVERKSGQKLMDFLNARMFRKIGIKKAWSTCSPEGIPCGGWGMNMTTRELARFGQLFLQEGVWNGEHVLTPDWVRLATSRQTWSGWIKIGADSNAGSDWEQGYGFQFWRCRHNAYRADGAFGQYTVVMPDQDAVVSIHAGLGDMQKELNLIWDILIPGMKDAPLPEDAAASAELERRCANLAIPPVAGTLDGVRQFMGSYTIADNPRGFRALYLFNDAQGNWYVKLYARCFPASFPIGYGKWQEGRCHIDPEKYESLGGMIGYPVTRASGALLADGSYKVRVYLTGTTAYLDLVFSMKDGRCAVDGNYWAMHGCKFTGRGTVEALKPWADVPALDVSGDWAERRKALKYLFQGKEFGFRPVERPEDLTFETVAENPILGGKGVHRRVKISCTGPHGPFAFLADAYFPKDAKGVPTFVSISLTGRLQSQKFDPNAADPSVHSLPVSNIVARGMAVVTFNHTDVAEDDPETSFRSGVFKAFGPLPAERKQRDWGALSAWAWAASRVADWVETQPEFNAKLLAVIGHSRGGKTALWAGATDERFALTCVNCSGTGGAKLNHMDLPWSESLVAIQKGLPHFFCGYYPVFAESPKKMTYDQHQLLALVAPRRLSVGSGAQDDWAGPAGERAAVELAAPAWEANGVKGLGDRVRYHVRKGPHDLAPYDWTQYMDAIENSGADAYTGRVK